MNIPSIPPPLIPNSLPQDVVARTVAAVQASPPLLQRAIDPAPKGEKSNHNRNNQERGKGGDHPDGQSDPYPREAHEEGGEEDRGSSVNISV